MAYTDTVPANSEIKERVKEIQAILKERGSYPVLSQIHVMDIMTKEYLQSIKK